MSLTDVEAHQGLLIDAQRCGHILAWVPITFPLCDEALNVRWSFPHRIFSMGRKTSGGAARLADVPETDVPESDGNQDVFLLPPLRAPRRASFSLLAKRRTHSEAPWWHSSTPRQ